MSGRIYRIVYKGGAVGEVLIIAERANGLWQQGNDERAQGRAGDRTNTPDIEHCESKHDHVQPVDLRADKADGMNEQRSSQRGIKCGYEKGDELVAGNFNSQGSGGLLASSDGDKRAAQAGMADTGRGQHRECSQHDEAGENRAI